MNADSSGDTGASRRSISALAEHKRGYRRAVRVGMAVSLVVHAVLILFVSRQLHLGARAFAPLAPSVRPPEGLELIEYREVDVPSPEEALIELPPREETRPLERVPELVGPPVPVTGAAAGPGLTNAERLQPREGDPRLWKDFADRPLPEYMRDGYVLGEGALRARLGMILDSLSLTEEQRRKAEEWLAGEEGDEWGVTPDGIMLGGTLIPVNLGSLFAEEGPRGREARQAASDLGDIQRADARMDVEGIQKERIEEMRERSREEIARRDSAEAAADSVAPRP